MDIILVNKDEVLPRIPTEKRLFITMIKFLDTNPGDDKFKLKLFEIFIKGITDGANKYVIGLDEAIQNFGFHPDVESFKFVYEIGSFYTLDSIIDTIPYILDLIKEDNTETLCDVRETLCDVYIEGIKKVTDFLVGGIKIDNVLQVVERINCILAEKENVQYEELWKDIRIFIAGEDYLRLTGGKIF